MSDQRGGGISWTDESWNPVRGCSRVSPGCENCYAEKVAARFSGHGLAYEGLARIGKNGARWTGAVRMVPEHLADPLRWTRPRRIFVNSMSDLFHEKLTNEQIAVVFGIMAAAPHTYQILTKRASRLPEWFAWVEGSARAVNGGRGMTPAAFCFALAQRDAREEDKPLLARSRTVNLALGAGWPLLNAWIGVSVEDRANLGRLAELRKTPAAIRFVSFEPLIGDLGEMNLDGINWAIFGGESGPSARPCACEWIERGVEQCLAAGTRPFVKQLGAYCVSEGRSIPVEDMEFQARRPLTKWEKTPDGTHAWAWRANFKGDAKLKDIANFPKELQLRLFPGDPLPVKVEPTDDDGALF